MASFHERHITRVLGRDPLPGDQRPPGALPSSQGLPFSRPFDPFARTCGLYHEMIAGNDVLKVEMVFILAVITSDRLSFDLCSSQRGDPQRRLN